MEADEKPKEWGVVCVGVGCTTKRAKREAGGITFHRFPLKDPALCQQWIEATKMSFHPTIHDQLCTNHFRDEDYKSAKRSHLKEDAVPSVFSWSRKPPAKRPTPNEEKKRNRYRGDNN